MVRVWTTERSVTAMAFVNDNRPENLELWCRPHPAGIRAAEALAWAREILVRYDKGSDSSNNAPS